jgi:hypothetical protein
LPWYENLGVGFGSPGQFIINGQAALFDGVGFLEVGTGAQALGFLDTIGVGPIL